MNQKLERKTQLLKLVESWHDEYAGSRVSNYHNDVKFILEKLDYDPAHFNSNFFNQIRNAKGWSARYCYPLTAWNSFCKFAKSILPQEFPDSCLLQKPGCLVNNELPGKMKEEIQSIMEAHIVCSTGTKLKKRSQEHIYRSFEVFLHYVAEADAQRQLSSLSDFTETNALDFKDYLMKTKQSPLTAKEVSANTLASILIDLRRIYKMGLEQRKLKINIFKDIPIKKHCSPKRSFCLSKEQVEKLRTLPNESTNELPLSKKFEQIRNDTMVSTQYEGALRAKEVVNLCWEDIPKNERAKSNVGPVIVRGGKARPKNYEDRIYIPLDRLDVDLYRWKKVRDEYCLVHGITPSEITIDGKTYHPIFFSRKGKEIKSGTYISSIFPNQLRKAGITLPKGYKTHILRHSRITHWVDDGVPFEKVHENARHADLEETWGYFHSNAKKRIEGIEKVYGLNQRSQTLTTSSLPKPAILRKIVETIVKILRKEPEILNSDEPGILFNHIETEIKRSCADYAKQKLFYTVQEVMKKWKLSRTQTYARINQLIKQKALTRVKAPNKRRIYLKNEIDRISSLIDSRKASIAFGYKEKVPITIPSLAARGLIGSVRIGKLHFFNPSDLVEYFYQRNR